MRGGYTFTNFDPSLTGAAVGSNVNGISNAGQVVGTEVDADAAEPAGDGHENNFAEIPV